MDIIDINYFHLTVNFFNTIQYQIIIRNDYYRSSIDDELRFQFPEITWTFSSISPAYGAGLLAARLYARDVSISDILKGDALAAT